MSKGTTNIEVLLAPKMQLPRLRDALVDRQRLLATLGDGVDRALTLVCAPAGFGKTTLVRQWLADVERRERAVQAAWVALDSGDNDPIRFWRYVVSACQTFQQDGGATALAQLQLPPQPAFDPAPIDAALTTLLNALTLSSGCGILVLDDYHLVTAPRIHQAMAFFLDHLPPAFHVVISTRQPPPLPLARLRARGYVSELTTADLRFTVAESAAFLQQAGAPPQG